MPKLLRSALRYFDQAIRDGSIRKASNHLHVASSAVNRQILQLEEEFEIELFERLPRGVRPTAAGEVLLTYIRRWNRETATLKQQMRSLRVGTTGTVRIAASEGFTEELLPRVLKEISTHFPRVNFSIISGDSKRNVSELLTKDADIVLTYDAPPTPQADIVCAIRLPLGVVATPDHEIARLQQIALVDCANYPLIIPGSPWMEHSSLKSLFQDSSIPWNIVAQVASPRILKSLAAAGLGIGFLTRPGTAVDIRNGQLIWRPITKGKGLLSQTASLLLPRARIPHGYTVALAERIKEEMLLLE
jgi:DNA-binding transcriptional LysR family regulator